MASKDEEQRWPEASRSHALHRPHHRLQRLLIGQSVLGADDDQCLGGQAAVLQEFPAVVDRHGLIGFRM